MQPFDRILDDEEIKELRKNFKHLRIKFMVLSIFTIITIFGGMILFKTEKIPTYIQDIVKKHGVNSDIYDLTEILQNSENIVESLNKDKGITPIHSHNDYWRKAPLFEALQLGINSVEADVWYLDDINYELFVGHHKYELTSYKTLNSLYLGNLNKLLKNVNGEQLDLDNDRETHGVFHDDPNQTLYLLIDIKNEPALSFKVLQRNLEVFLLRNFLTTYNTVTKEWIHGPITVIVSGDVPYDHINNQTLRNCFVDAPLYQIFDEQANFQERYPTGLSVFSSSSLMQLTGTDRALNNEDGFNQDQMSVIKKYVDRAHELGLKVRIWETPKSSSLFSSDDLKFKMTIWSQLVGLGVDLLNVDNLKDGYNLFKSLKIHKETPEKTIEQGEQSEHTINQADIKAEKEKDFEMEEIEEQHRYEDEMEKATSNGITEDEKLSEDVINSEFNAAQDTVNDGVVETGSLEESQITV